MKLQKLFSISGRGSQPQCDGEGAALGEAKENNRITVAEIPEM